MSTDNLTNPFPRPPDLWRAWEETAKYVARLTQQNTTLYLTWNTQGIDAPWMAQFNWVGNLERINKQASAGAALDRLWQHISANYAFFETENDAQRAPTGYAPDQWFSKQEMAIMDRLMNQLSTHCNPFHTLIIGQEIAQDGTVTVRARIICHLENKTITGEGTTLLKACQDLYPRTAAQFGP